MKKTAYLAPATTVTTIQLQSMIANSFTSVSGLDGVEKGEGDFAGGDADGRRSGFSVWDDED